MIRVEFQTDKWNC